MKKNTLVKSAVILIVVIILSVLLDIIIFNSRALSNSYDGVTFGSGDMTMSTVDTAVPLSEEDSHAIEVDLENRKILAEYNGESDYDKSLPEGVFLKDGAYYKSLKKTEIELPLDSKRLVGKLEIDMVCDESAGFTVECVNEGNIGKVHYLNIDPKIDCGIINVNEYADGLKLVLLSSDTTGLTDMSLIISNRVRLNLIRIFFFAACLLTLYFMLTPEKRVREFIRKKPEYLYLYLILSIGTCIIGAIGTNQISYDEQVHARAAHRLSFGTYMEITAIHYEMFAVDLPYFNTPEERTKIEAYEDYMNDPNVIAPNIGHQPRFRRAEERVYYPMSLGFFLGRKAGLSFAHTVELAKFFNLLAYALITFYAVKRAKGFKMVAAAVALIPNNVFLGAAFSYDCLVNSGMLLGTVLVLNIFTTEPDEKPDWKDMLILLLISVIGSLSKPVYIMIIIPLLFLSKKRFNSRIHEAVFKLALCGLIFFMIYNIFFPLPVAGGDYQLVGNSSFAGDKRNIGTSTLGQLSFILSNPIWYVMLVFKEMGLMLLSYTVGAPGRGRLPYISFAYLGGAPFITNWLLILTGVFASAFSDVKKPFKKSVKLLLILTDIALTGVIFSTMYVSYTPVGSPEILGVQGRYFTSLFIYIFACLFGCLYGKSPDKKLKSHTALYERLVLGIFAFVNFAMIMGLIILKVDV